MGRGRLFLHVEQDASLRIERRLDPRLARRFDTGGWFGRPCSTSTDAASAACSGWRTADVEFRHKFWLITHTAQAVEPIRGSVFPIFSVGIPTRGEARVKTHRFSPWHCARIASARD
jgi:hypothetical protein